jgi:hypothetical protein
LANHRLGRGLNNPGRPSGNQAGSCTGAGLFYGTVSVLAAKVRGLSATAQPCFPKLFAAIRVSASLNSHALLDYLQKLFRPKAANPAAWHAVTLSPVQAQRHARWVEQQVFLNWLEPYFKAYHLRKGGAAGARGLQVQLLQEPGRQGALFLYDPTIGPGNFRHFYEHLGERLLGLGYHRACADSCTQRRQQLSETVLKQLFKPNPTDCPKTGDCNQRFGLITTDLLAVNGQPMFIRVVSNAVLQPGFTPAGSFDELLKQLLHAPPPTPATHALISEYHDRF